MGPVTLKMSPHGPTVTALLRPRGATTPEMPLSALLDTGANITFVQRGLLGPKGFPQAPGGVITSSGFGTKGRVAGFFVDIAVCLVSGQQLEWWPFDIGEGDVGFLGVNVVLGRDLLDRCEFGYHGRRQEFTLSW